MNAFFIELIRILLVPIAIGLATVYISHKLNEKKEDKLSIKQADIFTLKLTKILKYVKQRNENISEINKMKKEVEMLNLGYTTYDSTEYPEMEKEEYLVFLSGLISDMQNYSLKTASAEAQRNFEILKTVNIEAIDIKYHMDCRSIMEIEDKDVFKQESIIEMESLQNKLIDYTNR